MASRWSFDRYEEYTIRLASDLRIPLVDSIEGAGTGWGLRRLSRSDFEKLEAHAEEDHDLRDRWLNRLQNGYDREKSQIVREIEELFSDVPCLTQINGMEEEDAA